MKTYINGNCIEQILTNAVELTQAEYNALPTSQKNHGTYIITDADSPSIPATEVAYDNNTTIKDAIDEKVSKSGDTMNGYLYVDNQNGTTSTEGFSYVEIGNSKAIGTDKNSTGVLKLYGDSGKYVNLYGTGLTNNRNIGFPNQSGKVCLLESLTTGTFSQNVEVTANTYYQTIVDWTGVDTTKILFSWVWWSNPTQDIPAQMVKYYNGTNPAVLHIIGHKWAVDQEVKFKICYLMKG